MSECLNNPMCQCGCDDYQPGTRDPRTGAPERRERYAAAIWKAYDESEGSVFDVAPDAAMAVADAETAGLRRDLVRLLDTYQESAAKNGRLRAELEVVRAEMVTQGQESSAYGREIDRLRAELSDMTENRNILRKWHGQAANAAESAEATIDRVRSVLDECGGSESASTIVDEIRAALKETED